MTFAGSKELNGSSIIFIHSGKRTRLAFITVYFEIAPGGGFTVRAGSPRIPLVKHVEEPLLANLKTFVAFARSRVGDAHLAEDVVQDSLLKAFKSAEQLRENENVTAWFYRILRRSIIDLYRRRAVKQTALERLERELDSPPDTEEKRVACSCVETLIPTLRPDYAELIRRLDLENEPTEQVSLALGLTSNNLRVRHHRARQQLRERLEQTCRMCAKHGCVDCTCED